MGPLLNSVPQIFEANGPTKFQVHKPRISLENTHEFPVCNTKLPQMSIQKFPEKGGDASLQVMRVLGLPWRNPSEIWAFPTVFCWKLQARTSLLPYLDFSKSGNAWFFGNKIGVEKALKIPRNCPKTQMFLVFPYVLKGILKKKSFPLPFPPQKHLTTKPCFFKFLRSSINLD